LLRRAQPHLADRLGRRGRPGHGRAAGPLRQPRDRPSRDGGLITMPEATFPPTGAPAPVTGGAQGYLRIATEEAFATPEILKLWLGLLDDPEFDDPGFRSPWSFYGTPTAERPPLVLRV